MDQALQAFLVTMAIVAGILSPFIFILLLNLINNFLMALAHRLNIAVEEVKKQPPFDDVEVNVSPATRVMSMRFYKNDTVIWAGSATQNAIDDKLEFTTEADDGR